MLWVTNSLAIVCQSGKGSGGTSGAHIHKLRVLVSPPASSQPAPGVCLHWLIVTALCTVILTTSDAPDCVTAAREFVFAFAFALYVCVYACVCACIQAGGWAGVWACVHVGVRLATITKPLDQKG